MLYGCCIVSQSYVFGTVAVADDATAAVQIPSLSSVDSAGDIGVVLGSLLPGIYLCNLWYYTMILWGAQSSCTLTCKVADRTAVRYSTDLK